MNLGGINYNRPHTPSTATPRSHPHEKGDLRSRLMVPKEHTTSDHHTSDTRCIPMDQAICLHKRTPAPLTADSSMTRALMPSKRSGMTRAVKPSPVKHLPMDQSLYDIPYAEQDMNRALMPSRRDAMTKAILPPYMRMGEPLEAQYRGTAHPMTRAVQKANENLAADDHGEIMAFDLLPEFETSDLEQTIEAQPITSRFGYLEASDDVIIKATPFPTLEEMKNLKISGAVPYVGHGDEQEVIEAFPLGEEDVFVDALDSLKTHSKKELPEPPQQAEERAPKGNITDPDYDLNAPIANEYSALFNQRKSKEGIVANRYRVAIYMRSAFTQFCRKGPVILGNKKYFSGQTDELMRNLRLSVHPDDLDKAWKAIGPSLVSVDSPFNDFKVSDVERMTRADNFQDIYAQRMYHGGQFTLYCNNNDDNDILRKKTEFTLMLEQRLQEAGVRPGRIPPSDGRFTGHAMMSFRNKDFAREGLTDSAHGRLERTDMYQQVKKAVKSWDRQ